MNGLRSQTPAVPHGNHWSVGRRWTVSILIALHLMAVVAAPCATPPPSSRLAFSIASIVEPYLSAMYLYHGYRFFAPNPGPSHLVRYEVMSSDGKTVAIADRFPNLRNQWPRLLYHRYFMVSERVWSQANVIPPPPQGFQNQQQHKEYLEYRNTEHARLNATASAIARHLQGLHGGSDVKLYAQEHLIPPWMEVAQGLKIDASHLYENRYLGKLTRDGIWQWPERENDLGTVSQP